MKLKRLFDLTAACLGLLMFWPVLALLALLVRLKLGSPVLFRQERAGLNGESFYLYKFRSMTQGCDANGELLPDALRLTTFGKLLRSTSLDELPGLWNVLCGEMSLVGPRPLLPEYLPLYSEQQARRHEVLPGITGWAQVNGRNAIGWEQKFELDVWYVDHRSFWLDLQILFKTVFKVLKRDGISSAQDVTMQPFKGSRNHD